MQRVSVVGNSGSGKSTTSKSLAHILHVPHIELDALHHLKQWEPIAPERFHSLLEDVTSGERWVIDGNYRLVVQFGPVWERADTVVWLDFPRSVVMRQIIIRSVRRVLLRQELWNGNREHFRNLVSWDPEESVIRWAWTHHKDYKVRYTNAMNSQDFSHIRFVRLQNRRQVETWLSELQTDK